MSDTLGLTNHIEGIVINTIDSQNFGRNQMDLIRPNDIMTIKELAAKINVNTTTHEPFMLINDKIKSKNRNDLLERNNSYVFINRNIISDCRERVEELVKEARLERAGTQGRFFYVLPSRNAILR